MLVVTGATGNVGSELTAALMRDRPLPFRIAAHTPSKLHAKYGADAPVVPFDYDDRATWPDALHGITTLFLLFPLPSPRTVNTRMKPLIDAAVAAGCSHIVYISVPGADASPIVPHNQVERHIRETGVRYTILRPSYFMQNLCRRISSHGVDIVRHHELFIPAGAGKTSFIDARDVAAVAVQVFTQPQAHANHIYTLTGPAALNFWAVAAIFSEVFGRPIRYSNPGLPRFWWRMFRRGLGWDTIGFMTIVYTLTRLARNNPISPELGRLLGRDPATMEQFVRDERWRWEQEAWT